MGQRESFSPTSSRKPRKDEREHYTKNRPAAAPVQPATDRGDDAERLDTDALAIGELVRIVPERGFAFLKVDGDAQDYFFHRSAWGEPTPFETLVKGVRIEFVPVSTTKGQRALGARFAPGGVTRDAS